jgi:hypothetical protein
MESLGFDLIDQSFAYSGKQGIDLAFINKQTGRYATLEAKKGLGLARLEEYTDGLRQGGRLYNIDRLNKYLTRADKPNVSLADDLIAGFSAGNVDSFASFYRGKSLYQLNFESTANFRLEPEAAIKIRGN